MYVIASRVYVVLIQIAVSQVSEFLMYTSLHADISSNKSLCVSVRFCTGGVAVHALPGEILRKFLRTESMWRQDGITDSTQHSLPMRSLAAATEAL